MIKSMTGFGRSTYENEGREYIIEIKSVYDVAMYKFICGKA